MRSWTHLERQRGGFGFLGGPGETQIEADRRADHERIRKIKRDLEHRRHAAAPAARDAAEGGAGGGRPGRLHQCRQIDPVQRADQGAGLRRRPPLCHARPDAAPPRACRTGTVVILSDTVGFVADLPTSLVAAFRATLEEVAEADLILHVRDIAHPDSEAQARDVAGVLSELGIDAEAPERVIEVWNKIDLLPRASARRASSPNAPAGRPVRWSSRSRP